MKTIFQWKVDRLMETLPEEQMSSFVGQSFGNHAAVQEQLIKLRLRLILLIVIFFLLSREIIALKQIPGFAGEFTDNTFKWLDFTSLNDVLLCCIPPFFAYTYYLMIANLIYRSQHRYIHRRFYEKFRNSIYQTNYHLFSYPQKSPGHIMKVLGSIVHTVEEKESEKSTTGHTEKGLVARLRALAMFLERSMHWFFLVWFLQLISRRYYEQNKLFIVLIVVVCVAFFIYSLILSNNYNDYLGRRKKQVAQIKANHSFLAPTSKKEEC